MESVLAENKLKNGNVFLEGMLADEPIDWMCVSSSMDINNRRSAAYIHSLRTSFSMFNSLQYSRRIEDGSGRHSAEEGQVLETHLGRSVLADADAAVGTDQVDVGLAYRAHADLKPYKHLYKDHHCMNACNDDRRIKIKINEIKLLYCLCARAQLFFLSTTQTRRNDI